MNVNDLVCVGAEPVAMLDYIAVEQVDPAALEQIAIGLKRGAELAGVEIPGGELAVLPELIRGHPSPHGFELSGSARSARSRSSGSSPASAARRATR
jgi:phosphoribosylformylglycinamidine cyclo-ligase